MYNGYMEVPITQFRQKLFQLVEEAMDGREVWVRHKGRRVRIVAEDAPSKLSRLTPLQVLNPSDFDVSDAKFKAQMLGEMQKEWEKDWEKL
jgi:antitoxin (DNA-binding transcriptional repressor) of toxin-antitoxin stability system